MSIDTNGWSFRSGREDAAAAFPNLHFMGRAAFAETTTGALTRTQNIQVPYAGRVYAIAFDMDTKVMEDQYGSPNWRNGYAEVRDALAEHGFDHQQGSVYFGTERVEAVTCVLAVQDLARRLPWFGAAVRDIRMLRIEEDNDLSVAIRAIEPAPSTGKLFDASKLP